MKIVMMKPALGALSIFGLLLGAPAAAQNEKQDVKQLRSSDTDPISGDKAYILYETVESKYDIYFLRSLTEEELIAFNENRTQALADERKKIRARRDGALGVSDEDLLPEATFNFVDRDIRNLVRMDSGRVFEKDGKRRTYVVEVPPGEYTVFGAGIDGFRSGTCMCMGSVAFVAEEGQITDLGTVLVAPENGKTKIAELQEFVAPEYIRRKALPYAMTIRLPKAGDVPPTAFADQKIVPVNLRPVDRLPNSLGMLINRMAPIDGVIDYDGDRVADRFLATLDAGPVGENESQAMVLEEASSESEALSFEAAGGTNLTRPENEPEL